MNTKLFIVQDDCIEIVAENYCIDTLKTKARQAFVNSKGMAWKFYIVDYDNKKWYERSFLFHVRSYWVSGFVILSDIAKKLGIDWTTNFYHIKK